MRRWVTVPIAVAVTLALLVGFAPGANAASASSAAGFDSRYAGESVFTSDPAGSTGQLSAIFFNSGTQPWAPGIVGLMVCLPDKTTCNVPSPNAAFASNWYSPTVYATVTAPVAPGENGFFVYNFAVPVGTAPGVVTTFNGDVGLLASGGSVHPEGYYQQNATPGPAGPTALATFDVNPIAADGVSTTTLTITIVDQTGSSSPVFALTSITATRLGGLAFCALKSVVAGLNGTVASDGSSATAIGSSVVFSVASTSLPGTCLLAITTTGNVAVAGTTAGLTTRVVGPGTKLAVSSGGGGTHPASVTGYCTIAGVSAHNNDDPSCTVVTVDVLDLNGLFVTGDNTRVVTATLDATTCAGGPGGPVAIQGATSTSPPTATSTAVGGRATFVLSSHGPYPGCHIAFTAPFLTGTSTSEVWSGL